MTPHTPSSNGDVPSPAFEIALAELQQIVHELEGGQVTLDASLKRFEEGIGLLRQCYQFLERAEQRIEILVKLDPEKGVELAPFDATATVEKTTSRRKKSTEKPVATDSQEAPAPSTDETSSGSSSRSLFE